MKVFMVSFLIGLVEILLLGLLMKFAAEGKKGRVALLFFLKVASYTVAIWFFVFKYLSKYLYCVSGFAMGVGICAILLLLYNGFIKRIEEE